MDDELSKYVLDELFPLFESLETQSAAILMFLKDKKNATDKKLAPYLDQAGNASSVKWRAARVRLEHLLSSAIDPPQKATERIPTPSEPKESQKHKEPEKPQEPQAKAQQPAAQPATEAARQPDKAGQQQKPGQETAAPGPPSQASQSASAPAKNPARGEAKTQDQPKSESPAPQPQGEKEQRGDRDTSKSAVAPPFRAIGEDARSKPAKPKDEAAKRTGKDPSDSAKEQKPASDKSKNAA